MKRKLSVALSICMICALIMTSCGIFTDSAKKDEENRIREAVGNYFEEMQDGTFASSDFADSDYVKDESFAALLFENDIAREIMGQAMSVLEFEILDASCDKDMENGACEVQLTYVDLESIIEDLGVGITSEVLGKAVLDGDAPTNETEITLEMTADESGWVIEDSKEIAELLGEPYTRITFAPDVADYIEAIDLLFASLAAGDMETVDSLSPDFDSTDFFAVSPEDVALWEAFYGAVEFEVTEEPLKYGNKVIIDVSLSFPNMREISRELAEDDERMLALIKEYFLNLVKYRDNDESFIPLFSPVNEEISSAFSDSTFQVVVESEFVFLLDSENDDLIFTEIPSVLFDYQVDFGAMNDAYWKSAEKALTNLYKNGELDEELYNQLYAVFVEEENGPDVTGEELIEDLLGFAWCHYLEDNITIEIVTEYDSNETYYLCYKLFFNSDWAGTRIHFVWFDEEGNQLGNNEGTVRSSTQVGSYVFGDYAVNAYASETIPPGTYNVVVVAFDNVIISEGEVEVK